MVDLRSWLLKSSAAIFEVREAVKTLKAVAQLHLAEDVVEDSDERRIVTRYIPLGVTLRGSRAQTGSNSRQVSLWVSSRGIVRS